MEITNAFLHDGKEEVEEVSFSTIDLKPLGILDLKHGMCRWPIGEPGQPGFHFCGCDVNAQSSYCEAHYRMAYSQVRVRPRQKPMFIFKAKRAA